MESKFLTKLSQDYLQLLEIEEYADVIIQVGQEPENKEFRAHSLVLRSRSTYFRDTLVSDSVIGLKPREIWLFSNNLIFLPKFLISF